MHKLHKPLSLLDSGLHILGYWLHKTVFCLHIYFYAAAVVWLGRWRKISALNKAWHDRAKTASTRDFGGYMQKGLTDSELISTVAKALEVLSADGAKALDYAADGRGWSDLTGNDRLAADKLYAAVVMLPPEQNLALMWRVLKDAPRFAEPLLNDLTCFVAHHLANGDRFGREGLRYWVRHWARRDGSSREAAHLYGQSFMTQQRFYREQVKLCLDGWFVAAKGVLEPVVVLHYEKFCEAA